MMSIFPVVLRGWIGWMFDVDNASVDDLEVVWASYNQMKYEWLMST